MMGRVPPVFMTSVSTREYMQRTEGDCQDMTLQELHVL
jgi:hypothetical protein